MSASKYAALLAVAFTLASTQSGAMTQSSTVPTAAIGKVQGVALVNEASMSVVYVATHAGLYRSASPDYSSWTKHNSIPTIVEMSPNSANPDSLLYSGPQGIYRSTNGGHSGSLVDKCPQPVFARSLSVPSTIYAMSSANGFGPVPQGACAKGYPAIVKSTDDGLTWTTIISGGVSGTGGFEGFTGIAVDPTNPAHVIAGYSGFKQYGDASETHDGGRTWRLLEPTPYAYWSPSALAFNPRDPSDMWVAWSGVPGPGGALRHSSDGGRHWHQVMAGVPRPPNVNAILFDPVSHRVYIDTDSGIYASGDYTHFEPFTPGGQRRNDRHSYLYLRGITENGYALLGNVNISFAVRPIAAAGNWSVAGVFKPYYAAIEGSRLLGHALSPSEVCGGQPCQFFDKGRLDNLGGATSKSQRSAYGAIVKDLLAARANLPIGGNPSTVTYKELARATQRVPPPAGFHGGVKVVSTGTFIPASPRLTVVPGYIVPSYFWQYMSKHKNAPDGWQQDIGVPLTRTVHVTAKKGALGQRAIVAQAFERALLTYDPKNPSPFQVERANIGADYATIFPQAVR